MRKLLSSAREKEEKTVVLSVAANTSCWQVIGFVKARCAVNARRRVWRKLVKNNLFENI